MNKEINILWYGQYRHGLTRDEVDEYLKERNRKKKIKKYRLKFNKLFGIQTCGVFVCPDCGKEKTLLYRHDVERIADLVFDGKKTYWD